jgi:hypothetical protein
MSILDPNKNYTFSQIFELNVDALDLAPELGYSLIRNFQKLPQYTAPLPRIAELRTNLEDVLPLIDLTNEQARREAIVSDLVKYLIRLTRARLSVEYPVSIGRLGGSLDYLVRTPIQLLVIEAKKEDMDNGFTQLVAELIAVDQWERSPSVEVMSHLFGAVTTGSIWQFCSLDRTTRQITQILNLYRVPEDIEELLRILIQSVKPGADLSWDIGHS